ncbi:hypothetical protein ZIOFF_062258 [Zingiber officinale]|uniref:DUF7876 domain-containing protein n=1 Tax=Zingiber officinale TaxID=94328 RepID=A0A8J5KF77_ZINOF|nr:hypothetical protein ZIOFF_062258 [Zingiber officinale]
MEMKFLNHLMISCTYIFVVALQCHWDSNASSDQDYRSSRNIAISLFKRYRNVIDRGSGDNLKEFISAGVNAYALGCTDEGLRQELINIKDSGAEVEGLQTDYGGTTVKLEIVTKEVNECILWLSIVFITILCAPPPTVVRWSSTPPVSAETMHQWKGFCAIIANAYYVRGMAWLPVKTLQLEQMAVTGSAEEPSLVASRMRITFSTLEVGVLSVLNGQELDKANILFRLRVIPRCYLQAISNASPTSLICRSERFVIQSSSVRP